ncbi:MAG: universal stress protein [Verrucomicrobiae bacterium]|nr:universal stress protein [Verrucomicrobiae bacterium]NNJ43809.1 universal stress protein [Akkermansiaceae bacterium]
MKHFKNMLLGVDFSDSSGMALKQALPLAEQSNGKITAVYVAAPDEVGEYEQWYKIDPNIAQENLCDGLKKFVGHYLGTSDRVECEVIIGEPYDAITHYIENNETDLIVIGSRGNDSLARHTGHFATKCVRHSPIPVLLVRRQAKQFFKRVTACVDFSPASEDVIKTAMQVALDEEAELHIVHAVTPPWLRPSHVMYTLEPIESKDFQKDYINLLRDKLEVTTSSILDGVPLKTTLNVLEHVTPDMAITQYLVDHHSDLVVVGRLGHIRNIISQCFIGTTAERLIRHSPCSVLTVPCDLEGSS